MNNVICPLVSWGYSWRGVHDWDYGLNIQLYIEWFSLIRDITVPADGLGHILEMVNELINFEILQKIVLVLILIIHFRSPFCSCHDSWAVVACAKLWPDWVVIFNARATFIFTSFALKAHKVLVKEVHGARRCQAISCPSVCPRNYSALCYSSAMCIYCEKTATDGLLYPKAMCT